jgi:hypothetical protein
MTLGAALSMTAGLAVVGDNNVSADQILASKRRLQRLPPRTVAEQTSVHFRWQRSRFRSCKSGAPRITRCFAASATAPLHSISRLWQYQ